LDVPLLTADASDTAGYIAIAQTPWPGSLAVLQSASGTGYARAGTAVASAVVGRTMQAVPWGPHSRFEYATAIDVQISAGQLVSVPERDLLDGANALALQTGDGAWEVVQFASAELTGPRRYTLSNLLRGQAGSDAERLPVVPAGARVVLLDQRLVHLDLTGDDLNRPLQWRVTKVGAGVAGSQVKQTEHGFVGRGRRPLSPVHIRGTRNAGGIDLTWIRRTRRNGDNWEQAEVPLGEDVEAYEVDILDGGSVVRTLSAAVPLVRYAAADVVADFGALDAPVKVRVHQMSAAAGRGSPAEATV
ncbi:MAG: hypothetical protein AAFR55_09960, partial [Pseudomonadota bacterium]